jgi:hypothetical protein
MKKNTDATTGNGDAAPAPPGKRFNGGNGSGYDGKPFINNTTPCSNGQAVNSRILVTENSAFMIRQNCVDMPLTEVSRESLFASTDPENSFTFSNIKFEKELPPINIPLLTKFYTQLTGIININTQASVFIIDLFDTDTSVIQQLKNMGKKVICNFSAGIAEKWNPDYSDFTPETLGNSAGSGERYVDINSPKVRQIILKRFDLAHSKACDGVDIDNMDSYNTNTGFSITQDQQVEFNAVLAYAAHDRSLYAGFHNAQEIIPRLVNSFDFLNADSCFDYNECAQYQAFTMQSKPAFMIQFVPTGTEPPGVIDLQKCDQANNLGISLSSLPTALDGSYFATCPN